MLLNDFYRAIITAGREADPRPGQTLDGLLRQRREDYDQLAPEKQALQDPDQLFNPYADTRILNGSGDEEVHSLLVGIDVDGSELLLADRLRERGESIDLVMAHHPTGRALAGLHDIMKMQIDMVHTLGVPISTAEGLMAERTQEIERRLLPGNLTRAADAARLLDIPLLCAHTPADNHVSHYLKARFAREKPYRLADVIEALLEEPEYQEMARHGLGPRIVLGNKKRRVGKLLFEMTGGTSGSKEMFRELAQRGIDTIVGMHISDDYREEAKKHHLNVIIAGHMSSDTLGMNLLLDRLVKAAGHPLEIIPCSGFRRFTR